MEIIVYLENILLSITSSFGRVAAEMTKADVVLQSSLYSYVF